ncbi:hypothetical protein ACVIIV_007145 [Bradyrhizobium sp. USDA 4354]
MQIGPRLGNSRQRVIRSFRLTKQKSRAFRAAFGWLGLRRLPHFSEATGPFDAAGSGSKPNTPTRYL